MTRDELNRRRMMFQIYANRNKMPQLQKNTNEEPVAHSATNDFLEYRKKVAAGTRMQRENNKSNLFNVTAANEQYHQDLMDQNIIIHAGTGDFKPTYYQKVENAFGPGKHRYFYTKEEWDAYQNELAGYRKKADDYVKNRDANNNAGANRGAKDSTVANAQKYKKESEQNNQRRESLQNAQSSREAAMRSGQQATQKMTEQRQQALNDAQSGREAAIKNSASMTAQKKGASDAVKDLGNKVKDKVKDAVRKEAAKAEVESIRSDTARWNKYDKSVRDQVQSKYSDLDTFDKFMERAEKEGGVDKFYDKLEKEMRTLQNNVDSSNKPGADRAANESSGNKKSSENKSSGDTAEERQKKILDDAFKEGANADDLASKYGVSTEYIQNMVYNASGKKVPTKKEIESKNSNNSGSNKTGTVSKEFQQELEANSKKNTYELKSGPKNGSSKSSSEPIEFTMENGKTVKKKSAKHDGLEDGITTSDDTTSDQEYLNFRARVEAGMKHFGMTRGLMSIPVNQALKNGESLAHAGTGNYKYYNKIKLPSGEVRYFYTKEEWDNYNNYKHNEDYAKNAGANKAKKEKYNANYESNIKKNEGYAQNAGADRAKQEKLSYDADSARKDVDNLFKNGYQQTNEKIALNSKIKDDYVHDAFNQALAEANGTTVEKLRKDPGLRSKLLEEFNRGTDYEKVIKVSQLMNNYYDALIDQDTNYVLNSIDFVKDYYHNGNPTGKGNTYSTSYKKDGFAIAKDLEDKWNTAIGNGEKNKSEVFVDFLKSLTDDERDVINMVNDYHYNNRLPGLLRQSQEGREAAEKEGQIITRRNTERNKYHLLNN